MKIPLRYLLWGSPNFCTKTETSESCLHLPCIELVPPPLRRVFAHPATGSLIVIKQAINSGRDKKRTVSPLSGWLLDGVVSLRFASIVHQATINSIDDTDKLLAMFFGICQTLQDVKCARHNNCWNFLLLENDSRSRPMKDPACPPLSQWARWVVSPHSSRCGKYIAGIAGFFPSLKKLL